MEDMASSTATAAAATLAPTQAVALHTRDPDEVRIAVLEAPFRRAARMSCNGEGLRARAYVTCHQS